MNKLDILAEASSEADMSKMDFHGFIDKFGRFDMPEEESLGNINHNNLKKLNWRFLSVENMGSFLKIRLFFGDFSPDAKEIKIMGQVSDLQSSNEDVYPILVDEIFRPDEIGLINHPHILKMVAKPCTFEIKLHLRDAIKKWNNEQSLVLKLISVAKASKEIKNISFHFNVPTAKTSSQQPNFKKRKTGNLQESGMHAKKKNRKAYPYTSSGRATVPPKRYGNPIPSDNIDLETKGSSFSFAKSNKEIKTLPKFSFGSKKELSNEPDAIIKSLFSKKPFTSSSKKTIFKEKSTEPSSFSFGKRASEDKSTKASFSFGRASSSKDKPPNASFSFGSPSPEYLLYREYQLYKEKFSENGTKLTKGQLSEFFLETIKDFKNSMKSCQEKLAFLLNQDAEEANKLFSDPQYSKLVQMINQWY